ncbi:hypothetical protein CLV48_10430 [Cecembia rubra]|uniref:Uncharacterized protein n=2 Tax=Cecembia rubra TaxID=1485585 RepID=A0A2P8E5V1_9BACT|nr:hypothetical protein CLV48_10430 [Cecembia rubra]
MNRKLSLAFGFGQNHLFNLTLIKMKKIGFALAFVGSMISFQLESKAQSSVDPGDGTRWICCQVNFEHYCMDMLGNAWNQDVKRIGVDTCS